MSTNIENRMIYRIRGMGRGSVFSPLDFYDLGSRDAVASALKRLKQAGSIRHLARALYDFPKEDEVLGILDPELQVVIKALERRENMNIYPSEAYAAYGLGLTEQVPMNPVFVALRPMTVQCGARTIKIRKAPVKILAIKSRVSMSVTQALKWIGPQRVNDDRISHLSLVLTEIQKAQLLKDIRYMPLNQHDVIRRIANVSR